MKSYKGTQTEKILKPLLQANRRHGTSIHILLLWLKRKVMNRLPHCF